MITGQAWDRDTRTRGDAVTPHPTIARTRDGDPHWQHDRNLARWIARKIGSEARREILANGTPRARILVDRRFALFRNNFEGRRYFVPCDAAFAAAVRRAILELKAEAAA